MIMISVYLFGGIRILTKNIWYLNPYLIYVCIYPWTSQFSFNWHLCKVLVSQGFFTKYFQNWLIDHASIPFVSLDGSRGKGLKMITWKILPITISNHASMIIFWGSISDWFHSSMRIRWCQQKTLCFFMATSKCMKIIRFPHASGSPSAHSCLVPRPFTVI